MFRRIVSLKDTTSLLRIRLVDQEFNILVEADSIVSNSMAFNLDQVNRGPGPLFRLYYMIVRNDSCLFKGHGDIKIN